MLYAKKKLRGSAEHLSVGFYSDKNMGDTNSVCISTTLKSDTGHLPQSRSFSYYKL